MAAAPRHKFQADVMYMPADRQYKYVLAVIDVFSRFAWTFPLTTLSSQKAEEILSRLFKHHKPLYFGTDNSTQFVGLANFLKENNIVQTFGTAYNSNSSAVVERFLLTLRRALVIKGRDEKKGHWVDRLPVATNSYNNEYHSTIKMTPHEAYFFKENRNKVYKTLLTRAKKLIKKAQSTKQYKVGDTVKVRVYKKEMKRSTAQQWSDDNYKIISTSRSELLGLKYFTLQNVRTGRIEPKKFNINQILKVGFAPFETPVA